MAVFVINGTETDSFSEALDLVRMIWSKNKAQDVAEQLSAVTAKVDNPAAAHAATGAVLEGSDVAPGSDAS